MNKKIVGFVESVNGMVVKKDVVLGQEDELKVGDLIALDDSIWVRSLDGRAVLKLHNVKINLNAGMRINLDENFLRQNNSFEFFSKEEIENISKKSNNFTIALETDFQLDDKFFGEDIDLAYEKGNENYDNLEIDYKFTAHTNSIIFKFICEEDISIKAYLMGSSGYILEKPIELITKTIKKQNITYFIIGNKFNRANSYLMYLNVLDKQSKSIHKEVFCEINIKI